MTGRCIDWLKNYQKGKHNISWYDRFVSSGPMTFPSDRYWAQHYLQYLQTTNHLFNQGRYSCLLIKLLSAS